MKRLGTVKIDTDDEDFKYLLYADINGKMKIVNPRNCGLFRRIIIDLFFT